MPDAFFTANGVPRAVASIRRDAHGQPQSLNASVPDGDTIAVHVAGSGSVRFLGIDTPEKSFELPGFAGARRLDSPEWETYLADPLAQLEALSPDAALADHLRARIGPGAGANHHFHAENAKQALISLAQSDMAAMGQDLNTFGYFLAFSFDVFDAYGRFLAFINRNQPNANNPGPRPPSDNLRMLERGAALPYFIWPNVDPFRGSSLLEAVISPGTASDVARATPELRQARDLTRQARASKRGVFDQGNPLRFEAFEVRYLGRLELPNRAVIDLSRNDDVILRPQSYFRIPNPEDRLFIPLAFVPLFATRGWRLEGWF